MSMKTLDKIEKRLHKKLREQVQENLAQVFEETNCKAVGREIRAGRNVTGNAEFGVRMCVHERIGPRYDPAKNKFYPMTSENKKLEEKFIELTNQMLETGGFRKMDPELSSKLEKQDNEFQRKISKRI